MHMSQILLEELEFIRPELVILEGVSYWANSDKSTVATKSGANFFLSYMVGSYLNTTHMRHITCRIILAQEWKGQLPDEVVRDRVFKNTSLKFKKSEQHVCDAVGMGLAVICKF